MRPDGIGASPAADWRQAAGTRLASLGKGPRVQAVPTWRLTLSYWNVVTLPLGSVLEARLLKASYVYVVALPALASTGICLDSRLSFWSKLWVTSKLALPAALPRAGLVAFWLPFWSTVK